MNLNPPPVLEGTTENKLEQLWDYLYQLIEQLNIQQQEENNNGSK